MAEIINLLEYKRKKEEAELVELKRLQLEVEDILAKCPVFPEPYTYNLDTDAYNANLSLFDNFNITYTSGRPYGYDERDYQCEYEYVNLELDYES